MYAQKTRLYVIIIITLHIVGWSSTYNILCVSQGLLRSKVKSDLEQARE